ncbi:MAG: SCO family protein [Deltaproteobacteria bacterium]|nr:SCO family protein [Deltaproteobacteria bacterium]
MPGIEERLGESIPEGLTFLDEYGSRIELGSLVDKPTILSLTYFSCKKLCNNLSANLAGVAGMIRSSPGAEYSILTVSIDEKDTFQMARGKKRDYIKATGIAFPDNGWRFLVGDRETIGRLAASVGFGFRRLEDGFDHPAALVVLSAEGRIIRYLYGDRFLPMDIQMALAEASAGRTGPSIPKLLQLCYRYDPASRTYVLDILKVSGIGVLFTAALFFIYLNKSGRKKDQKAGNGNHRK